MNQESSDTPLLAVRKSTKGAKMTIKSALDARKAVFQANESIPALQGDGLCL
jgi:hypothetical protein